MTKILLGHLASNGDCLYATTVARQIKADFPGCHLTWAISSMCRAVIDNNPDVDDIWEVEMLDWSDMGACWHRFEQEAWRRVSRGDFDRAFMTQISPARFERYDGTIRPSVLRCYPGPITVPVESVIELSETEIANVETWAQEQKLDAYEDVVLFECASKSGQSFVTPDLAVEISRVVLAARPNTAILLSTHLPVEAEEANIIHAGDLSMRETARLTHHADLFVGCGSGLTVVATSGAAKAELPNIQVLKESTSVYASFRHDFEHFGKPAEHFIEITKPDVSYIAKAIIAVLEKGVATAREKYDMPVPLDFDWYCELMESQLVAKRRYLDAAQSLVITMERYGRHPQLVAFAKVQVEPFLDLDPDASFAHRVEDAKALRAMLAT